jgi:hypothetical protein
MVIGLTFVGADESRAHSKRGYLLWIRGGLQGPEHLAHGCLAGMSSETHRQWKFATGK